VFLSELLSHSYFASASLDSFESHWEIENLRPLSTNKNKMYRIENYTFCTVTEPIILDRREPIPRWIVSPLSQTLILPRLSWSAVKFLVCLTYLATLRHQFTPTVIYIHYNLCFMRRSFILRCPRSVMSSTAWVISVPVVVIHRTQVQL
jgi:hypothetical protein